MCEGQPAGEEARSQPRGSVPPGFWSGPAAGRSCLALAAVLWSLSGAFTKLLTQPTPLHLHEPQLSPLQIAFFRALFAGLVFLPTLRRADVRWHLGLIPLASCFAAMNGLFVSALARGPAANAIILQYTAPLWLYLASIWLLREPAERRNAQALVLGLAGIGLIAVGPLWSPPEQGLDPDQLPVIALALGSGLAYAGVLLCLRVLRGLPARWLTSWEHLCSAAALLPWVLGLPLPSGRQLLLLLLFGTVQMALPYWLVARGLRAVSPQEAGLITLLEPLLNPLWAYLASPATEKITLPTLIGGSLILAGLLLRYRRPAPPTTSQTASPPERAQ